VSAVAKKVSDTNTEFPDSWQRVRFGEVIEMTSRQVDPKESEYRDLPHINGENIESGTGRLMEVRSAAEDHMTSGKYLFETGMVLYSKLRPYLKKAVVADFRGVCSADMYPISPKTELLTSEFLLQLLLSDHFTQYAISQSQRARMPKLNRDQLFAYRTAIPPLPEQLRITAVLREQMAAVDKARAAAQARLEAVKALPAAFLREIFGTEPTFSVSPVTPTRPVQTDWKWHRLTDIARLATGHTPSRYRSEYWTGDIPWLQLADIRKLDGHEAQDTSEHTNSLGLENSAAVLLPKGTVCMSRTASVGFFAIMGRPMATSQDFVNWICSDKLAPWFLMYLLIANRDRIRELGSGAVHHTIYFPTVESFSVCVPPIAEQRRIGDLLRSQMAIVENGIAAAESEMEIINLLPAALLREVFSGAV